MDDAVRLANASIEKNGTKVIVSNGGTASLLKRRVQAHILEIRYTNFNLVHAITTALEYSPSVAIVGFGVVHLQCRAGAGFFQVAAAHRNRGQP